MVPSRGYSIFLNFVPSRSLRQLVTSSKSRVNRYSTYPSTSFAQLACSPASKHQIYLSRSNDPYINLSIEHYLLQKTPADSNVLFLYTNRPSVVIGRNQNPWLEVNLRLLDAKREGHRPSHEAPGIGDVLLVRRRSGGGTVFHDEGNLNYCVICPTADFTRDKHAEMVVRALRRWVTYGLGARVNERHDIVLDQGSCHGLHEIRRSDTHRARIQPQNTGPPLKISGSAYKLTRLRALHHGTCLLASPNLSLIHAYLDSPARPFMKARGVESVRSPIGNFLSGRSQPISAFEDSIILEFGKLHQIKTNDISHILGQPSLDGEIHSRQGLVFGTVSSSQQEVPEIGKGLTELKSTEWIYSQTPQFILSSHQCEEDARKKPALPPELPLSTQVYMKVKSGAVTESRICVSENPEGSNLEAEAVHRLVATQRIHEIRDWKEILQHSKAFPEPETSFKLGEWLNEVFGR